MLFALSGFIMMSNKLSFDERTLEALKKIPRGRIVTYKILAKAIGWPRASRAVGNAVGRNPGAPKVPCHRVVRSDGRLGGYSGPGGLREKIELLNREGVKVKNGRVENFYKLLYNFKA